MILSLGVNHKSAPLEIREKLAIPDHQLEGALLEMTKYHSISEGSLLSTCNRLEIYCISSQEGKQEVLTFLQELKGITIEDFAPHLYSYQDEAAVRHLFYVASGMDSLIVGEPQILGQIKDAFEASAKAGGIGPVLHRLFQSAIEVGKGVRTETSIGENPTSVGEAAASLARQMFGSLEEKMVLLVGAGKMSHQAARALAKEGGRVKLQILNRSHEKAIEMAQELGGEAVPFVELPQALLYADMVITSTSAPHVILTASDLRQIMRKRRDHPIFLIDIAVPRDIDPEAKGIQNLFLYDLDDLQQVVEEANRAREREMERASSMVEKEVRRFFHWYGSLRAVPLIKALTERAEEMRRREVEKVLSRFSGLSSKDRDLIEAMSHSIVNKILHRPLVTLKEYANHPMGVRYLDLARGLFGLTDSPPGNSRLQAGADESGALEAPEAGEENHHA